MNKIKLFKYYSSQLPSINFNCWLSSNPKDLHNLQVIESNLFDNGNNVVHEKPIISKKELLAKYVNNVKNIKTSRPIVKTHTKLLMKDIPNLSENKSTEKPRDDLNIDYLKLKKDDSMIGNLILTATSRQYREKHAHIVLEGSRLILDALAYGLEMKTLLFSRLDDPAFKKIVRQLRQKENSSQSLESDYKLIQIAYSDMQLWSQLTTTPGLMAIFRKPTIIEVQQNLSSEPKPITVICDNIRDPQNMGSIIRVSAAVSINEVILLSGCTDPWSTKSLRSGCGGQYRIPINSLQFRDDENLLNYLLLTRKREDFSIYLADNKKNSPCEAINYNTLDSLKIHRKKHIIVVIGGETHGIDLKYHNMLQTDMGDSVVNIPLENGVESLNTSSALAILLYEIRRQFKVHEIDNI